MFSWIGLQAGCVSNSSSAVDDLGGKELILKRKDIQAISFCACEEGVCIPLGQWWWWWFWPTGHTLGMRMGCLWVAKYATSLHIISMLSAPVSQPSSPWWFPRSFLPLCRRAHVNALLFFPRLMNIL